MDGDAAGRSDATVELLLAAEDASVPEARHFVQETWRNLPEDVLDDIALIVTELVTNAIKHGEPQITLSLRSQPFAVDVAVLDHGAQLPPEQALPAGGRAVSGRGLAIVDRLASSWGVQPLGDRVGKAVWASIRQDGPGATA